MTLFYHGFTHMNPPQWATQIFRGTMGRWGGRRKNTGIHGFMMSYVMYTFYHTPYSFIYDMHIYMYIYIYMVYMYIHMIIYIYIHCLCVYLYTYTCHIHPTSRMLTEVIQPRDPRWDQQKLQARCGAARGLGRRNQDWAVGVQYPPVN